MFIDYCGGNSKFNVVPFSITDKMILTNSFIFMKVEARRIGVPGELKAYKAAHMKYGRLPWKDLFEPTIKMVKHGYPMGKSTEKALARVVGIMKKIYNKTLKMWPQVW